MSETPDCAILQNSRTKYTSIWVKEKGEWTDAQPEEYEILNLLAKTMRTSPNPSMFACTPTERIVASKVA